MTDSERMAKLEELCEAWHIWKSLGNGRMIVHMEAFAAYVNAQARIDELEHELFPEWEEAR